MQVKLRGFRIELGEVEAAMADVPGVALAAALVLKDASGSQQLVGYVTPDSVDPAAVLDALKARLPVHFVPHLVMPLGRMPLTPADKVDRKALETRPEYQPDWSAAAMSDEYVAPRNKLEVAVQAVWQEVLGMGQVSVESDFFRIGGNSIMANKVTSRLRASLGAPLSGGALFQHPTIAALAKQLAAAGAGEAGAGPPPRRRAACAGGGLRCRGAGGGRACVQPAGAAAARRGGPPGVHRGVHVRSRRRPAGRQGRARCLGGHGDAPRVPAHALQGRGRLPAAGGLECNLILLSLRAHFGPLPFSYFCSCAAEMLVFKRCK